MNHGSFSRCCNKQKPYGYIINSVPGAFFLWIHLLLYQGKFCFDATAIAQFSSLLILLNSRYPSAQQEEEKENIDIDDENFYKTDVILSFPLNNPDDFDLKCKPSAIREKKLLTLDSTQPPITCFSRCFDAYVSKRCAKKYYAYNKDCSREEHKGSNCDWLILIKEKSKTCVRQSVSEEDVVELTRRYHVSKNNKGFLRTIATVRRYLRKVVEPFQLMIYKWTAGSRKALLHPGIVMRKMFQLDLTSQRIHHLRKK